MNDTEFKQLLPGFYARNRSLESWHAKMKPDDRTATLHAWREVLANVSFDDAVQAIKLVASGEEEEPSNFDKWPAVIRRIAGRLAFQRRRIELPTTRYQAVHEPPKFRCPRCQDNAWAEIYDREAMRLVYSYEARVKRFGCFDWFDGHTWRDLFMDVGVPIKDQVQVHNRLTGTCCVLCTCDAAMPKVTFHKRNNTLGPLQLNDHMFPTLFDPRNLSRMQEFWAWVEENAVSIQTGAVDWAATGRCVHSRGGRKSKARDYGLGATARRGGEI